MALRDASHRELGLQKWKDQRIRVLKRDGYICAYCGQEADQVDHVIPRKVGGTHDLDNLVACCKSCNSKKGALDEGSFLGSRSTPPAFPSYTSPMTTGTVPNGPCVGQTEQD
jgi:5-methylcytosine-specific restriction endonuclease McrA